VLDRKIEYYQLLLLATEDKAVANGLDDTIARHKTQTRIAW